MEYKGKLYGKASGVTFPLLNTTDDWDKMEARIKELEDENNALKKANGVEQSESTCNLQSVSNSVLVDWNYDNEYGTNVTVKGIVDLWCVVEDIEHDEPYCVPLEFVRAIYDESTDC